MHSLAGTLTGLQKQTHAMEQPFFLSTLKPMTWRSAFVVLSIFCFLTLPAKADEAPVLTPEIAFWQKVFAQIDTGAGLVHDERNLSVIYETLKVRKGIGWRKRKKYVDAAFKRYRTALNSLASGKRASLTDDEQKALDAWPPNTSNATFKSAAKRLRFQLGQADRLVHSVEGAASWREYIDATFTAMGIPRVATAIPHVESSYNPQAVSSVGAKGVWQFTAGMGRRFMRVDHIVDERLDIYKATIAAGELLLHNYAVTGSWPLAITAYNHGTSGIRRAKKLLKTSSINTIVRQYRGPAFGFASRNFYAAVQAAANVDANRDQYFKDLNIKVGQPPISYTLPYYIDIQNLLSLLDLSEETFKTLNPALLSPVWKQLKWVPKGHTIYLPCEGGDCESMVARLESAPEEIRHSKQKGNKKYVIKRGDTLIEIAATHRLDVEDILSLNNLSNVDKIRFGQTLLLPEIEPLPRLSRFDPLSVQAIPSSLKKDIVVDTKGQPVAAKHVVKAALNPELIQEPEVSSDVIASTHEKASVASATPTGKSEKIPLIITSPEQGDDADLAPWVNLATRQANQLLAPPVSGDPFDYSVANDNSIEVQAEETLGHLGEWLNSDSRALRHLNGFGPKKTLRIGQRIQLDFSNASQEEFETRRREYHQTLQAAFFSDNIITSVDAHKTVPGESLWVLANNAYSVPLWLLRQYNPDISLDGLSVNSQVYIPVVKKRDYANEVP